MARRQLFLLLSYLLVGGGYARPRDRVAYALWPDATQSAALGNLRRQAFLLERALPPREGGWLDSERTTIGFQTAIKISTDIAEFERCSRDPELVDRAVDLYRGDFLEGHDDDWIVGERDRLRGLQIDNLGRYRYRLQRCGRYHAAITAGRRLLALDPFRENVIRELLWLHDAIGDRGGALAEYERFARRLRDEIGVEPMAETAAWQDALRRNLSLPGAAFAS